MRPWEDRPIEIANLLNPAFCGEVLSRYIRKYEEVSEQSSPYALSFLVLPIVLHRRTRESISPSTREQMHVWLQSHQEVRVGFAERAKQMVPITKEAIAFLLQIGAVAVDEKGGIRPLTFKRRRVESQEGGEVGDCYKKAETVGRWFARGGTPTTIYTMWGVRP